MAVKYIHMYLYARINTFYYKSMNGAFRKSLCLQGSIGSNFADSIKMVKGFDLNKFHMPKQ